MLFTVLYYLQPHTYLIDSSVASLSAWEAIAISIGGLALAWLVYDALCRTVGQRSELALALLVLGRVVATAYGSSPVRGARRLPSCRRDARHDHGRECLRPIIPAHREMVHAKEAGREPDPG